MPARLRSGGPNRHQRRPRSGRDGLGKDLKAAQAAAYAAVEKIHFDGAHFRRDIAAKALR